MKSSQPSHLPVSEIRASIRAAGLRGTMPRIAVLLTICNRRRLR